MSKIKSNFIASLAHSCPTPLTRHAAVRSQQRSIPHEVIDLLIDFGEEEPAGSGCFRYYFTRRTWQNLIRYIGKKAKKVEKFRSTYVVVGDGQAITVGWIH